jgi:prevent-host-death family protein
MLIDTKQIVPITDLRLRLSKIIEAVENGSSFFIAKKGKIKAKIVSAQSDEKERRLRLFEEITQLRKKNDEYYKKSKKVWNSVELIRKMREDRTKHLFKLAGIPYKK